MGQRTTIKAGRQFLRFGFNQMRELTCPRCNTPLKVETSSIGTERFKCGNCHWWGEWRKPNRHSYKAGSSARLGPSKLH